MKQKALAVILAAVCMLMCGCVPLSVDLQRSDQAETLVIPEAEALEPAVGDTVSGTLNSIMMYYVSEGQQLVPVQRTLIVQEGESLISKAVLALMDAPDAAGLTAVIPQGTQLIGVERSGDVAVIDLSIDARSVESEQQLMWMRMALAATLSQIEDIRYVQLLIGGRDDGLLSMPSGAYAAGDGNLAAAWAQRMAERELLSGEVVEGAAVTRTAIIYYPSRDGRLIVPVAREVQLAGNDCITPVIEAVMTAPTESGCLRSPFPAGASVLMAAPEVVELEDGRRMIRLTFDANLMSILDREGLSAWQLFASLTDTLTGFVPDIDGLIVLIGDGQLTRIDRNGTEILLQNGEMSRADYPDAVGRLADVYLSAPDGGLLRLPRVLDQQGARSPRALLKEVFAGPASWESEAARVAPDGVGIEDLLGVRVYEGEAVVNLSSNLYRCCQGLNAQQERNLVYAMVNTITGLPGVSTVRFQLEGEPVDTLVSAIFLRGSLMRNPGLIRERQTQEESAG